MTDRHQTQPSCGLTWLNPPETLTFPGSPNGPWARYVIDGTVRYPRLVARDEDCAKELKQRTFANLYNFRGRRARR